MRSKCLQVRESTEMSKRPRIKENQSKLMKGYSFNSNQRMLLKESNDFQNFTQIVRGIIGIWAAVSISGAIAENSDSVKATLKNCEQCHGVDGKAAIESWPNLACQNRGYLYARLLRLQNENDHDIDKRIKDLSIGEIDDISQHYSEIKCSER